MSGENSVFIVSTSSEGSDEPAHMRILTRWFIAHIHILSTSGVDVDEDLDQRLDFKPRWKHHHGHLFEYFVHV